ncbi:TetR/AcrR family transcriptional regulator [Pseudoclavibacter terrae]|uniref:TetR/AcrR family transcriptional regulator n=1 Tax=Pseudoclavibacter terrae TaxID=1530195 RepID=A0A7J5AYD1_9MICO|nr:TetR/AcrR family transcriptional regulator [Pseudoclavibacter terrae]KAB1636491.1 TetR/AcrR family transcriptional regulator [Pseudoclavibacter terrae]
MADRQPLSRTRILDAAVRVADGGGLAAVSMRSVAREVGVEAMSLYHHVANKQAVLDALAGWAFEQIPLPPGGGDWRAEMGARARAARKVLGAHPWALGLLESRSNPAVAVLAHHDATLGSLRAGGFSVLLASHAYSLLDAYVFGFVLTEQNLPFEQGQNAEEFVAAMELPADEFPHLAELVGERIIGGAYDFADEFDVGLEMILDQLETRLALERGA